MIGIVLVRSRCLISSAVSNPSMPGIWTSSRITAKSSRCSRMRSASAAGPGASRARGRAARGSPRARAGSAGGRRRAGATAQTSSGGRHLREPAELDEQRGDLVDRRNARRRHARRAPHAASRRARPSRGPGRRPRRRARRCARGRSRRRRSHRSGRLRRTAHGMPRRRVSRSTSIDGRAYCTGSSVDSASLPCSTSRW